MKKIRIELQQNSKYKKYTLFDSAESLYVWLKDCEALGEPAIEPVQSRIIELTTEEFIEVEWMGCEFVNEREKNKDVCLNFVRLAKASPTKNASGIRISPHYGWTVSHMMPWKNYVDENVVVTRLQRGDEHKLDLAAIFQDDVTNDSHPVKE